MLDVDMLDVDMLRVVESWHCSKVYGSALYFHNIIDIQLVKWQYTCLVVYFNIFWGWRIRRPQCDGCIFASCLSRGALRGKSCRSSSWRRFFTRQRKRDCPAPTSLCLHPNSTLTPLRRHFRKRRLGHVRQEEKGRQTEGAAAALFTRVPWHICF